MENKQQFYLRMLKKSYKKIVDKRLLTAKAIFGLFEANSINDDDISVQKKGEEIAVFSNLTPTIKETIKEFLISLYQIL